MKKLTTITLDFETYYDKKQKYSLSARGMTYEKYIRDKRFEIIGLAYKIDNRPTEFLAPHEIKDWLDHIEIACGWDNVRCVAQNGRFDMAILGWLYGVYPKQIADTMLISRACQLWDGHSLDNITEQLRIQYNWGAYYTETGDLYCGNVGAVDDEYVLVKGEEVHNADGKHLMDFTDAEYDAYAEYCKTDVDLTYSAYRWFMDERKFPDFEIDVMTYTIEMFTFPILEFDKKVLEVVSHSVNAKRQALLDRVGATVEDLRSDAKFAQMLLDLGVKPPMKQNSKGEMKYAFAKKDLDFLALLEHEDENVVDLVQARLGNKSSQAVTRVQSFIELAERGNVPIPLEYAAAHTLRWGGCLAENTRVIVKQRSGAVKEKYIQDVTKSELVWDGVEFVTHKGVTFSGFLSCAVYKPYDKGQFLQRLIGTSDHLVMVNGAWISLSEAIKHNHRIDLAELPKFRPIRNAKDVRCHNYANIQATFDITDCGPRNRFVANGYIVHNSDGLNFQNINRNQLVTSETKRGTYVFYKGKADRVVEIMPDGKVYLARHGVVENEEDDLHVFGLRDALKAPSGYCICVQDLSQVELRMNSWLWGEQWILDALVSGKDIYKVTASSTYGVPYEEVTKSQRFVGKSQQLGLGYAAGVNGLKVVMGKRSEEFTDDQLQSFVNSYRATAPNIKRGWDKCKTALGAMVSGVSVPVDIHGLCYTDGHRIMTPGGMSLTYRNIHKKMGSNGYEEFVFWGRNKTTKKPDYERTFGGKIDENLCQHLCRNIMAEMMLNIRNDLRKRGWDRKDAHLCLTVHDEVIVCCREEIAEEVNEIMQYRMSQSPDWCSTLPLACDGDIAKRYGCAK